MAGRDCHHLLIDAALMFHFIDYASYAISLPLTDATLRHCHWLLLPMLR